MKPHASLGLELDGLPSQFEFVSDSVCIDSIAAVQIQNLVQTSLPGAAVVSLRRFANRRLWKNYVARRDEVADQNSGNPNVKLLFHGTHMPERILGTGLESNSEGFDFRHCKAGEFGIGSYFATHAAYPVRIYPKRRNADGTFTLLIAEVACGAVQDKGDEVDRSLHMPSERRPGLLYHTVRGTENSVGTRHGVHFLHGEQFVIYDKAQAYPHFACVIEWSDASPSPPLALGNARRAEIVFHETSQDRLMPWNGWKLSCHAHEHSGDKRNHSSWWIYLHEPGWGGSVWRIMELGGNLVALCLEGVADSRWLLSCHAHEHSGDKRNHFSWWTYLHKEGWHGCTWECIRQGEVVRFAFAESGPDAVKTCNGWQLSCHANQEDVRNASSFRTCLHAPGDYGCSWKIVYLD